MVGYEEYYLKNLSKLKKIKHILFELHNNLLSKTEVKRIFYNLKKISLNQLTNVLILIT